MLSVIELELLNCSTVIDSKWFIDTGYQLF